MQSLRELYKIGRGPSSSHTMGPERAARDFMARYPAAAEYRVVLYGSLARTGKGHLTDRALLGVLPADRTKIVFDCSDRPLPHPNTLEIGAYGEDGEPLGSVVYLSVGGGTIREAGAPVCPADEIYPFRSFAEIRAYCELEQISLGDAAFRFERPDFGAYLAQVWRSMKETARRGLTREGLLPGELHIERKAPTLYRAYCKDRTDGKRLICSYAYATAEENAGGGVVVTAPTCGASGVLPAVLLYLQEQGGLADEAILRALAAAGAVGAVNAFAVVDLARLFKPLAVFDYGQRYVGLQSKQSAVAAAESYYILTAQKIEIIRIERILFEPAHLKARIPVTFIQALKT